MRFVVYFWLEGAAGPETDIHVSVPVDALDHEEAEIKARAALDALGPTPSARATVRSVERGPRADS